MAKQLKKGDKVEWNTSQGKTKGTVKKKLTSPTKIKGHAVKASKSDPEYLVESSKTGAKAAHKPSALKKVSGNKAATKKAGASKSTGKAATKTTPARSKKKSAAAKKSDSTSSKTRSSTSKTTSTGEAKTAAAGKARPASAGTAKKAAASATAKKKATKPAAKTSSGSTKSAAKSSSSSGKTTVKKTVTSRTAKPRKTVPASPAKGTSRRVKPSTAKNGKDVSQSDEAVIAEFKKMMNIPPKDLDRWLDTDESKKVGFKERGKGESVGHESGRKILNILAKRKDRYTNEDISHIHKVVGYVKRHLEQKPKGDITASNWRYSLMNWGHDPAK